MRALRRALKINAARLVNEILTELINRKFRANIATNIEKCPESYDWFMRFEVVGCQT